MSGVPESLFVDADGIVRYKQWGVVTREVIEARLPPLLEAAAPDAD